MIPANGPKPTTATAITAQMETLSKILADLAEVVPSVGSAAGRLGEVAAVLDEAARELAALRASGEAEPMDLESIEGRLALLERLKRKYGKDVPGLLTHLDELRANMVEWIEKLE